MCDCHLETMKHKNMIDIWTVGYSLAQANVYINSIHLLIRQFIADLIS